MEAATEERPVADAAAPPTEDDAWFRSLYEATAPRLRAFLRRMTSSDDLADDVLQDTYIRFLNADRPPMNEAQTRAYLYRTSTRLVYDRWRRLEAERRWSETATVEHTDPAPVGVKHDVEAALERLKPRERTLLWLAYAEGYRHREIAGIMDIKEMSVRVLLFRARKKLTGVLDELGLSPEVLT